ncbi:hypothetical protein AMECASPLE_025886 [Ameca splendens]|uniref:Uncharacterized protein n=1 Tax=Ameca splendens TaxID=208324 RepID=A0ABV1AB34_9TELE
MSRCLHMDNRVQEALANRTRATIVSMGRLLYPVSSNLHIPARPREALVLPTPSRAILLNPPANMRSQGPHTNNHKGPMELLQDSLPIASPHSPIQDSHLMSLLSSSSLNNNSSSSNNNNRVLDPRVNRALRANPVTNKPLDQGRHLSNRLHSSSKDHSSSNNNNQEVHLLKPSSPQVTPSRANSHLTPRHPPCNNRSSNSLHIRDSHLLHRSSPRIPSVPSPVPLHLTSPTRVVRKTACRGGPPVCRSDQQQLNGTNTQTSPHPGAVKASIG